MDITKGFCIILLMIGIIMLAVYYLTNGELTKSCENKVIYKYIPKTLAEEQTSPYFVSEIFSAMFEQGSVWIDSIDELQDRKREVLNKYFISQF